MQIQSCPQCGNEFSAYPSQRRVYCSRQCLAAAGVARKKKTGEYKPCAACGKEFWVTPAQARVGKKYCSIECKDRPKVSYETPCLNCQELFRTFPSTQQKYCSWDCAVEHRRSILTKRNCKECGSEFYPKGRQVYCSWECYVKDGRDGDFVACATCEKQIYRKPQQIKDGGPFYCSRACLSISQRLTEPGNRFRRRDGYVYLYFPDRATSANGQILEHRWVMEQKLGRPLLPTEHIHHINGIKDDNRPENLEIIAPGAHAKLTIDETSARRRREKAELEEYRRRYGPLQKE